jgi:hypothetical protein
MTSQSTARSESVAAFVPELERLITEAMDEWKVPGLAVAVVQNGEVALVRAYGLRDGGERLRDRGDLELRVGCHLQAGFDRAGPNLPALD